MLHLMKWPVCVKNCNPLYGMKAGRQPSKSTSKMTFSFACSIPSDQGGEDASGHRCPATTTTVSSAWRLPQAAGQRLREGDQTEGTRGQSGENGELRASTLSSNVAKRDVRIHFLLFLQPNKLSDGLVQQFLLPDQTPSILEAEMSLRAEQQLIGSNKLAVSTERRSRNQEVISPPHLQRQEDDVRSETSGEKLPPKREQEERIEEVTQVKQVEEAEERQEPEGRQADVTVMEQHKREVSGATSL